MGGIRHRRAQLGAVADHGQEAEVVAGVLVEEEGVGQRADHRRGGPGVAALLEPHEIVDADPGEGRRPLRGADPGCDGDPSPAGRHRPGSGPHGGPAGTLGSVCQHLTSVPSDPPDQPGPAGTRVDPAFLFPRGRPDPGSMQTTEQLPPRPRPLGRRHQPRRRRVRHPPPRRVQGPRPLRPLRGVGRDRSDPGRRPR